ncbi:MAG TPA: DUF4833 domain-containing protein [Thermoanaerobaculia bacterium]|nr:DUF4833 domain-containing protein [Thermoanaerobaculia bacterium]
MRSRAATVLAALVLGSSWVARAEGCPEHLFTVARSKNSNIVVYDAKLDASGDLDAAGPVESYWILNADRGQREELNRVERERAYGVDVVPGPEPRTFALTFKANKKRKFALRMRDGCAVVLAEIDGHEAVLSRIFVKSKEGGLTPTVEEITVSGSDASTGAPVRETFAP